MRSSQVYIVEENKDLQNELSSALEENGFDVKIYESGYPVVSMMDNWPDLFLIDIELPGINGLEVCKWLKSHDESKNIPVIFLSGDPYLKILAASACADDYIEKPVDFGHLIDRIRDCLTTEKVK